LVKAAHTLKVEIGSVLAKVIRSTNRREREREREKIPLQPLAERKQRGRNKGM
jgi:hypothetical protein